MRTTAILILSVMATGTVMAETKLKVDVDPQFERDMVASMLEISPINPKMADQEDFKKNSVALPNSVQSYIYGSRGMPKRIGSIQERTIVVDLCKRKWAAYSRNGKRLNHGYASAGKAWCHDVGRPCRTPAGTHRIYRKTPMHYSSKYPVNRKPGRLGSPMPHAMFFKGGFAIHAGKNVNKRAHSSHGCVNVPYKDSKWLYYNFASHGTKVVILPYCGNA